MGDGVGVARGSLEVLGPRETSEVMREPHPRTRDRHERNLRVLSGGRPPPRTTTAAPRTRRTKTPPVGTATVTAGADGIHIEAAAPPPTALRREGEEWEMTTGML